MDHYDGFKIKSGTFLMPLLYTHIHSIAFNCTFKQRSKTFQGPLLLLSICNIHYRGKVLVELKKFHYKISADAVAYFNNFIDLFYQVIPLS